MNNLQGKHAVITGGGQGIGLGISRALLAAGANLLIAQRNPVDAGFIADADRVHWVKADLSRADSFDAIADASLKQLGHVDILINNAGFMIEKSMDELQIEDWNRLLSVNLTAPMFLSQRLLPLLRTGGTGTIINIGSIEGLAANPQHTAYCASKGGLHALTRAMAVDLGSDGIRVNALAPGWIRSALSDAYIDAQPDSPTAWQDLHQLHPLGRVGTPKDIGDLVVYLASDAAAFITGQIIVIDGGRTCKLPLPF